MVSHWCGAKRHVPAAVPLPATIWVVAVLPPLVALHCKFPGENITESVALTENTGELIFASVVNVTWLPYAVPAELVAYARK